MIKNKSNTKEFKYEKIQIDIIVKAKKSYIHLGLN